jgi:carboxypeptidase family protein
MRQTRCLLLIWVPLGAWAWGQNDASFAGIVIDRASAPIAKVSVTLGSLDRVLEAESGSDGQFQFPSVPAGTYDFEISAPGFVKQKRQLSLSNGDSRQLTTMLEVGSLPDMNYCGPHPSIRHKIADAKERQVAGTVRDYFNDKPIASAKIALVPAGEAQPTITSSSDHAGKFALYHPPAGKYTLRISRADYRQENVKELLIPREDSTFVDLTMLKRNQGVACQ